MPEKQTKIKNNRVFYKNLASGIFLALFFIFAKTTVAQAANLYFSPASGSYTVGQTFTTAVYVSSAGQAVNAVSGTVNFPADILQVTGVSKSGSVLTLWVQDPSFSNANGSVNFEGIVLNPGFTGSAGKIVNITFKVKATGSAAVTLSNGSILANDGSGTNILQSLGSARFNIEAKQEGPAAPEAETPPESIGTPAAPKIESATHPDTNAWYASNNPEFNWAIAKDVSAVSLLISDKPQEVPSVNYDPPITSKQLSNIDDGVWYLHIRLRNKEGWGGIAHYRFQVDRSNPEYLNIKAVERTEATASSLQFIFDAVDKTSGIEKYEIQIDNGEAIKWIDDGTHTYTTESLTPGRHTMIVRAIDRAGNFVANFTEFNIEAIPAPEVSYYPQSLTSKDIFVVKGQTYPDSQVLVFIKRDHDEVEKFETKTDAEGKFIFVAESKLPDGIYHFWVEVIDAKGAHSLPTPQYRFMVEQPKFLRIGNIAISFLSVLIPIAALLVLILILFIYTLARVRRLRVRVAKEVNEAESSLHYEIESIKKNIVSQLRILEQASASRQLTKEERMLIDNLSKNLDEAEAKVFKEIEDIDIVVGDKATKKKRNVQKKSLTFSKK